MLSGNKIQTRSYLFVKRVIDVLVSVAALALLSPLMIYAAIRVKLSSPGPALYAQERAGLNGKVFTMYKFRSMYADAEVDGPRLAEKNDARITTWGKIMRKWKIDELPQLFNVISGKMTLVGPRPERPFYINRIVDFNKVLQVKPGVTSLGMITFGYAENIEEIKERMKLDLDYIQRRSLALDVHIMMKTLRLVLRAKGQ